MTKKRLVDCVLTNTDEDLQSFDSDETQPPSEDQRNENETQDEVESDLYDDVESEEAILRDQEEREQLERNIRNRDATATKKEFDRGGKGKKKKDGQLTTRSHVDLGDHSSMSGSLLGRI
ncbi:hypothetical protein Syun_010362 [Stephania yunnanensis]|uniref:Uncharacterized protein n=1 Tax=Stephania yunnanensis TaxID=152371 RepID=A0AAP0KGD5_9MAGN